MRPTLSPNAITLVLDKPITRLVIGIFWGVPVTLLLVPLTIYGVIFGFNGLVNGVASGLELLAITAMGVAGVVAGWHRILKRHSQMTRNTRINLRRSLILGVISSGFIGILALYFIDMRIFSLFFIFSAAFGLLLISGTPVDIADQSNNPCGRIPQLSHPCESRDPHNNPVHNGFPPSRE